MFFSGVFSNFISLCLVLSIAPEKIDIHMPNSDILGVYTFNTSLGPSPCNVKTLIHWNVGLTVFHICWHMWYPWKTAITTIQCLIVFQSSGEGPKNYKKNRRQDSSNFFLTFSVPLHTAHCTLYLYTANCTLNTANCTQPTVHCTLNNAPKTLHTKHCTLNTAQCTLHTTHWTPPAVTRHLVQWNHQLWNLLTEC